MSIYKSRKKTNFRKSYVIAELACGWEGDVKLLKKWIKKLASIKPDAIKLHIHYADNYITANHSLYPFYKKMEVDYNLWPQIFQSIKKQGIDVIIMPNEIRGLSLMKNKNVDGVVLHSANLLDFKMLKELKNCKKPVFIGVGGSYIKEIKRALSILKKKEIILMLGFQNYPTRIIDHKFSYIKIYSKTFNLPVGFDDHVSGGSLESFIMPTIARSKGAAAIEKHVTDKRSFKRTDYQSALEFDEFEKFLKLFRSLEKTLYDYPLRFSKQEMAVRDLIKKQLIAAKGLKANTKVRKEDIVFKRSPKKGLSPIEYHDIIGKLWRKDVSKNSSIKRSDIK